MSENLSVQPEGTWQAPTPEVAQQIGQLTPEQRQAQAEFLRDRYPRDRQAIDTAYGVTPSAPATQADKFDAMWKASDPAGADIDLSVAMRGLTQDGHAPADVAAFAADLKQGLAATGLHLGIASAIGESMRRRRRMPRRLDNSAAINRGKAHQLATDW